MLSFKRIAGSSSSQAPFSVSAETIANNEDLLTELLLRLPIKSLLKFKCVSKHWLSLISNPHFSRRRISCDSTPPCGLFLIERGSPYAGYQFVALDSNHSKAPFKNLTFVNDPSEIKLIQSCNGLLLFRSLRPGWSGRIYYVYNPTTKQHTTIHRRRRAVGAALAFDPSKSPHYKVICVRKCQWLQHQYKIQMYSSNSGQWRVSGDPFTTKGSDKQFNGGVFCNGVIYWLDVSGTGVSLCFDIDGEKLEQLPRRKEIIDRRQQIERRKMRNELLVKWKVQLTEDAKWVEDWVKKTYPNLEDKVFKGRDSCDNPGSSMAINEQTEEERKKGSLGALDAQIEGDEGRDIQTKALTALDGRDEDEMKTDGKEASSARLSAGKRENVSVFGRDEKGKDLCGRLR